MATDDNDNNNPICSTPKEEDSNKSFVKKVSLRVSELIPSSLTKWFSRETPVRYREDDEESESSFQPPSKRSKPSVDQPFNYTTFNNTSAVQTSFEPVAGPSGLCSRKLLNVKHSDFVNGEKELDSSEESASDNSFKRVDSNTRKRPFNHSVQCGPSKSSLLESVRSGENERSLFKDRSITTLSNSSLSSRRPSFSASTFGSPNFVDNTLSTKRVLNSPFYSGQTVYGGASAFENSLNRSRKDVNLFKTSLQVQVRPASEKSTRGTATLSRTARRILDTLEQYTTPVLDAQRIPKPIKPQKQESLLAKYTGVNPYLRDHVKKGPTTKELQVPTVSELLKMKEQLQDSTESVRQIATTSKSKLNEEYKLKEDKSPTPSTKHKNKMKTKVSAVRQQKSDALCEETVEEVKLPNVALPITTLPKFDFSLPPPPSAFTKPAETAVRPPEAAAKSKEIEFVFSKPLVLAENLKSVISINNFTFSEPILKKPTKSGLHAAELKLKKLPAKNNGEIQTAAQLMTTGSVMDILGKNNQKNDNGFDSKFKLQEDQWECTVCLVRNKSETDRCVACTTARTKLLPQPDKKQASPVATLLKPPESAATTTTKCVDCHDAKAPSGGLFGMKFKPPSNTWECPTCMIRNGNDVAKCAACETPNPSAPPPKKPEEKWECPVCMVRNAMDVRACPCCETPQPGGKVTKVVEKGKAPAFSFGMDKQSTQFVFGIKPDVKVDVGGGTNAASVFGDAAKKSEDVGPVAFSFGIKASESKAETNEKVPEVTTNTTTIAAPVIPTFTFTPPEPATKPAETIQPKETTAATENKFNFIFSSPATIQTPLTKSGDPTKDNKPSLFSSTPKTELFKPPVATTTQATSSTFTFGNNTQQQAPTINDSTTPTSKPTFNFQIPTTQTTQKPSFAFGAPEQSQQPPAKIPAMNFSSFGAKDKPFAFGSTANGTTQMQNGGLNFGSELGNNKAAGFAFGSSSSNNNNSAQTPVFSFGTQQQQSAPQRGFNFGTNAFSADAKPVFNFTQGGAPSAFSAQPSGEGLAAPQRKVRKALRRANR